MMRRLLAKIAPMVLVVILTNYPGLTWADTKFNLSHESVEKSLEAELFLGISSGDDARSVAAIAAGADVNARERNNTYVNLTALHRAAERGLQRVVEALVTKGAKVDAEVGGFRGTPLTLALANGHESVARFLIDHGANAAYVDNAGYTMLHVAVGRCTQSMIELLIAKGANVNAASEIGTRPLQNAIRAGNRSNATLLIGKGADVNAEIGEGTPLAVAAKYGGQELVELLVARGADVNSRSHVGLTALHHAANNGHKEIAEFLIAKGADVNAAGVSADGKAVAQPIFGAAYRGHIDLVKLLVAHGADFNIRASNGGSPLSSAAFGGHLDIVIWLVSRGADVNPFEKDYEVDQ